MQYPRSNSYDWNMVREKIMGPNPLKILEELMQNHRIPKGALVMDLGSGTGLTSVFLAREYGFSVVAADLWSDPSDNKRFFDSMGLTPREVLPVKADAEALPFAHGTFDAVVSTDSYHYFGREETYLGSKLLPFVKPGGYLYIAVPGMKKDLHDNLPPELLLSWTPEELDTIHDAAYWRKRVSGTEGVEILSVSEMEGNEELWADWLSCDNPYAVGDRKSMNAGGGKYMNFVSIILRKK